jgi:hypothetical protein
MLSLSIVCVYYSTKFCSESLFHMQDSNINEHTHAILDINFFSNMFASSLYKKYILDNNQTLPKKEV